MSPKFLLASAGLLAAMSAHATVSVNSAAFTYSQSFDSLASSGATNAWTNDSTLKGWSLFIKDGVTAAPSYGTAASNTGGFFAFGSGSDRALGGTGSGGAYFGSPASGAVAGWIAVAFTNTSATAMNSFTLNFDGEQWRDGGTANGTASVAQTMKLQYGFGTTMASVATWNTPGGNFDFTSPSFGTTSTGVTVNGNVAGLAANRGGTVATNWAAGDTLWVRWVELNDIGNDHSLAIDNVKFSVTTAVPEPSTYAMLLAGLGAVGFIARRRRA